ncbi:ABC transporter permease [Porifericola rhodea]|uniref:ABC transporter permease n=1 Tax=Porifericola rhodea TaxID=930972 RepID=UPI002666A514|nr:ABC transporter permease [Porifericola rhodea]WKN30878.1 ABC transporter permease [Porifericola rhodea]
MFKNYLTSSFRNLLRNKFNTFINIVGLSLSLACCISIYAFVKHEYSFDAFHKNAERIYRVVEHHQSIDGMIYSGYLPFPVADALRQEFDDIEMVTQVFNDLNVVVKVPIQDGMEQKYEEGELAYVDEYFLQTFDYPLLAGNRRKLFTRPEEVVLTQKLADKYYGLKEGDDYNQLIGKTIVVDNDSYQISGVLEDIARNTNITFKLLLSYKAFETKFPAWSSNWYNTNSGSYAFVTLKEGQKASSLKSRFTAFVDKYFNEETASRRSYHLQPLTDVHTNELYGGTVYATPAILIIAFVSMGIIILSTACINFINLATAQSIKRAKEIGIRKALGGLKSQLITQYMTETLCITIVSAIIGLGLAHEFTHVFNHYLSSIIDFGLSIDFSVFYFLVPLILAVSLLAGFYPAYSLSSYQPVQALKQNISTKNTGFYGKFSLRKSLVVVQFFISQLLIIGTLVVAMQMKFINETDLGFQKENIYITYIPESNSKKAETFRHMIEQQTLVEQVSLTTGPPLSTGRSWTDIYNPAQGNEDNKHGIEVKHIDENYLETFEIKLLAGRNLNENDRVEITDSTASYSILLNLKAVKMLGFNSAEEAINQKVFSSELPSTIVGVVDNFVNESLQQDIHPCQLLYTNHRFNIAAIKLNQSQEMAKLGFIQEAWEEQYPDHFFTIQNMQEYFEEGALYVIEDVMYQAFKIFSFLSIMIGCLGLYGLVSYLALQREKEIGIRKTLGGSVRHIVYLFSKEFSSLVIIAFIVAAPLSYFAMQSWLHTFHNRIELSPWIFLLALLVSLTIASLTVGYKSVKAALQNPSQSLKSE